MNTPRCPLLALFLFTTVSLLYGCGTDFNFLDTKLVDSTEKPACSGLPITLIATARDAKGSATVEGGGGVIYVEGLPSWPETFRDRKVVISGNLVEKEVSLDELRDGSPVVSPGWLATRT